jgi:protein-L-isoaspartate(D-aspartate) O-methyltransferase
MANETLVEIVMKESFFPEAARTSGKRAVNALRRVDRRNFLPRYAKREAYIDSPVSIGYKQTCSQPSLVAYMIDLLELKPGMKVLEVGTGCGYHAAVVSQVVGKSGKVFSIEYLARLNRNAEKNLKAQFGKEFRQRFKLIHGDGSAGYKRMAPYDRIYLAAGVQMESFNPDILAEQLNPKKGILLFPEERGDLIKHTYRNGQLKEEEICGTVRFVPLKGKNS